MIETRIHVIQIYESGQVVERTPEVIFNKIRIDHVDTFQRLSDLLQKQGLLKPSRRLDVEEQLFIFIRLLDKVRRTGSHKMHGNLHPISL